MFRFNPFKNQGGCERIHGAPCPEAFPDFPQRWCEYCRRSRPGKFLLHDQGGPSGDQGGPSGAEPYGSGLIAQARAHPFGGAVGAPSNLIARAFALMQGRFQPPSDRV